MLCGQHFKWSLYLNFAWSASFPESVLEIIANLCGPQVVVLTLPCKHCCGQCGVWSQHRRCWPAFFKNAKVSTRVESVSECFLRLRFQGTFYHQLYTSVWGAGVVSWKNELLTAGRQFLRIILLRHTFGCRYTNYCTFTKWYICLNNMLILRLFSNETWVVLHVSS